MKAKLKKTGKVVEVENLYDDGTALAEDMLYKVSELDFDSVIDWEKRRYELAKEYSKEFVKLQHYKGMTETGVISSKVAVWSVELADALIEELKKKKSNE